MAVTFLPQAQPQYPGNADVSQNINALGNSLAQSMKEGRDRNALIKVGTALKGGDIGTAREAAFESGNPELALQVNNLLTRKEERGEDVAYRNSQAAQAQKNADRSYGLQERQIGATAENTKATREMAREQFEFNKIVKNQEFQLKLKEIDAKAKKLDEILTPGQRQADKEFADEFVKFRAAGGYSDVDKQLNQLDGVLKDLESGKKNLTGPILGSMPDMVTAMTNPAAVSTRERVEEVVQRNLRTVLGAQFTQAEGDRLIARSYNPRLPEAENAARLRALVGQMRTMAKQKQEASDYFEKNGTIAGFKGSLPNATAMDPAQNPAAGPAGGLPPPPPGFVPVQ